MDIVQIYFFKDGPEHYAICEGFGGENDTVGIGKTGLDALEQLVCKLREKRQAEETQEESHG